ncbi:FAD:protein FMN transferase [Lapidilactobacillus luobeiensis]|uniref:FAD:protein FMN transferase n=1 Tax=Lapidilactobacillus luobeiensis TaxID=2950371 RepID=UPI0021C48820|nr:FAD:protein FMN transferase [Lapidilactobacillus luobeiensis]
MAREQRELHLMGTVITLDIQVDADPEPILAECATLLQVAEHRFSANAADSELMAVNHAAGRHPVKVHPQLFALIELGKTHSCAPASHLNIAIGPLVQTWRIGFSDARVPSAAEIAACLPLIDPRQIQLNPTTQEVYLPQAGMAIDLGALAKGYSADLVIAHLQARHVQSALVNLGGNLVTWGPALAHADHLWRLGIQNPHSPRGDYLTALKLPAGSVVTSGIYERHLERDGHSYHHIFDSRTGYPLVTDLASLTIFSEKSVTGEIWTSRLFGHDANEILAQIAAESRIEGILVFQDGHWQASAGLQGHFL